MRKKPVIIALALLLAISLIGMISQLIGYRKAELAYENARDLLTTIETEPLIPATETEAPSTEAPESDKPDPEMTETAPLETEPIETEAPETIAPETEPPQTKAPETEAPVIDDYMAQLSKTELSALKKVNPDVIGWILIPGTSIDYPLMQGEDNTHYLDYAWDGSKNAGGAIYMDYRSDSALADFHTIIYGHRMYRDAMFNALKNYADEDFLASHPSVYLLTETGVARYDIFAAYDADVKGASYRLGLTEAKGQQALFNYCRSHSVIDSGIVPIAANGDRLLTLSTCSSDGGEKTRWVVHCVLGEFAEK